MEMIERPMAVADRVRRAQRRRQVVLGAPNRLLNRHAPRQVRRDSGGQRATCSMCIACLDAWTAELLEDVAVEEHVDRITGRMPAFHEHVPCTRRSDAPRRLFELRTAPYGH